MERGCDVEFSFAETTHYCLIVPFPRCSDVFRVIAVLYPL